MQDMTFLSQATFSDPRHDAATMREGWRRARESYGDRYADYLIEHDREYVSKGIPLTPWPLSLVGNDGD